MQDLLPAHFPFFPTVNYLLSLTSQMFCPYRLRGSGTAATNMCLVATGAVEAFFEIGIHCWDIAAGAVIVKEAGGVLMDVNGVYPFKSVQLSATDMKVLNSMFKCVFRFGLTFLGGPFDLMSRRMVCANNKIIADRIIKEIEIFEVTRDDVQPQKKWECHRVNKFTELITTVCPHLYAFIWILFISINTELKK